MLRRFNQLLPQPCKYIRNYAGTTDKRPVKQVASDDTVDLGLIFSFLYEFLKITYSKISKSNALF